MDTESLKHLKAIAKTCRNPLLREKAARQFDLAERGVKPPPIREYLAGAILLADGELAAKWSKLGWVYAKGVNDWAGNDQPTPWLLEDHRFVLARYFGVAIVPHTHISDLQLFELNDVHQATQSDDLSPDQSISFSALHDDEQDAIIEYLELTNSADWLSGSESILSREPVEDTEPRRIEVTCPNCSEQLFIRQEYIGKRGRCKYCKEKFTVPAHSSA